MDWVALPGESFVDGVAFVGSVIVADCSMITGDMSGVISMGEVTGVDGEMSADPTDGAIFATDMTTSELKVLSIGGCMTSASDGPSSTGKLVDVYSSNTSALR